jgi:long-chain acyl-CoA synthetase
MYAGAATVTVYPTTVVEDVEFILSDSGSRLIFLEDAAQLARVRPLLAQLPQVTTMVLLDGEVPDGVDPTTVLTWRELQDRGERFLTDHPDAVTDRIAGLTPADLATIVYTSGTTGRPKGVELPHRVWTYETEALIEASSAGPGGLPLLTSDDKQYLWLPLAHVLGKLLLLVPVAVGCETAVDGRTERIITNLPEVKPTFMGSPPRVYEKAYGGVATLMSRSGGITEKLYLWASRVCGEVFIADNSGVPDGPTVSRWSRLQAAVADRLVMAKIRARFGGRIRYFIAGAAALDGDIARWFGGAGMPILEGYGLTETCAASSLAMPWDYRPGYLGRPLPGTEARTDGSGEILLRGPGVMDGFHNNPGATTEMIDADGWLHTGDLGEIDDQGRIRMTGRKKELFKTSNGKYVAPTAIEAKFKSICPIASQMVVIGDNRNYTSALVTLDPDALSDWAGQHGITGDYAAQAGSTAVHAEIQEYIDNLNSGLSQWEQIKKFTVLHRDLTVEDQEITPSLKLRRGVVADHFRNEIDALYT